MKEGFVQVYTGNGKGKTTAALGLLLRSVGAGYRVYLGQFIKSMSYHEIDVLADRFPEVTVELYGIKGCIYGREADESDRLAASSGYEKACQAAFSGEYDLVILDEICIAIYFGLLTEDQVLRLLREKAEGTELVLTGRYAPEYLTDAADLVTEMREIRHYYTEKGIESREGIEC